MNISSIFHDMGFEIEGGRLFNYEHELGNTQISISVHGIIRVDGFSHEQKHLVSGYLKFENSAWCSKVSSKSYPMKSENLSWDDNNEPSEAISVIANTSLCTLFLRHITSHYSKQLTRFATESAELRKIFKVNAQKQRHKIQERKKSELLKTHRPVTNNEVEKLTKMLKGEALSSNSFSYENMIMFNGTAIIGCDGTKSRVGWYLNGKGISLADLSRELKNNAVIELTEAT
ncbi:hypothetical protein [Vibrio sp. D431a]|uniref:hypothetical protein n=1 Tax=Vibrio sp. D431a TaxID=2837388 RepID=UPI002554E7C5|nr:hypothetical protein [Vibrio sp. D431a]MDK9790148.1 hypothetical protein [Vibrio sp. D431a]